MVVVVAVVVVFLFCKRVGEQKQQMQQCWESKQRSVMTQDWGSQLIKAGREEGALESRMCFNLCRVKHAAPHEALTCRAGRSEPGRY